MFGCLMPFVASATLLVGAAPRPDKVLKHRGALPAMALSHDGRSLATGLGQANMEGPVYLWSVSTGRPRLTLTGHTFVVASVAFAPDDKRLVSVGFDDTLRLWDVKTGRE